MASKLPALKFAVQRARTADNMGTECEMTVGIINLTDSEVARLRAFVDQQLIPARRRDWDRRVDELEAKRERYMPPEYGAPASSGRAPVNIRELVTTIPEAEPATPGNRFSGLDINPVSENE